MLQKITSVTLIVSIFLILASCKNGETPSNITNSIQTSINTTNETTNDTGSKSTEVSEISEISNNSQIASESTQPIKQTEEIQNNGIISKDALLGLFKLKKSDILKKLGDTYKIVPAGAEGSYDGYHYKKLGITIAYDSDDTIAFVDCDEDVNIDGARTGMTFAQIQEKLGKSEVKETWIETPENIAYEISYTMGDCIVSFLSQEKDGTDCGLSLYKKR